MNVIAKPTSKFHLKLLFGSTRSYPNILKKFGTGQESRQWRIYVHIQTIMRQPICPIMITCFMIDKIYWKQKILVNNGVLTFIYFCFLKNMVWRTYTDRRKWSLLLSNRVMISGIVMWSTMKAKKSLLTDSLILFDIYASIYFLASQHALEVMLIS